jgi:hypothetical protein
MVLRYVVKLKRILDYHGVFWAVVIVLSFRDEHMKTSL